MVCWDSLNETLSKSSRHFTSFIQNWVLHSYFTSFCRLPNLVTDCVSLTVRDKNTKYYLVHTPFLFPEVGCIFRGLNPQYNDGFPITPTYTHTQTTQTSCHLPSLPSRPHLHRPSLRQVTEQVVRYDPSSTHVYAQVPCARNIHEGSRVRRTSVGVCHPLRSKVVDSHSLDVQGFLNLSSSLFSFTLETETEENPPSFRSSFMTIFLSYIMRETLTDMVTLVTLHSPFLS